MVYIFLADGFEEIEALTVVDVLRRAEIDIKMVSIKDSMVTGSHGISVKADCLLPDVEGQNIEMLVLPGGMPGAKNLEASGELQKLLKAAVDHETWIAAICAAPMILGNQGYLNGREAICFPGFEKHLEGASIMQKPVVCDGRFITSKGAGTALDFAFAIVEKLKDKETAQRLSRQMQYCCG